MRGTYYYITEGRFRIIFLNGASWESVGELLERGGLGTVWHDHGDCPPSYKDQSADLWAKAMGIERVDRFRHAVAVT